jgi:hypothetical protein
MKKILILAGFIAAIGTAPVVLAHNGVDDGDGAVTATRGLTEEQRAALKTRSQTFIAEQKQKMREHTQEQRQKNCEARKGGLTMKLQRLQTNSASYLGKIDKVFTAAQTYITTKNIKGVDSLIAAANQAKTTAQTSVTALGALQIELDCTDPAVAGHVATFRAATQQAHDDLFAYKKAVKALLESLRDQKEKS